MKTCNKCGMTKNLTFFHKSKRGDKFGVMGSCKTCWLKRTNEYRAKHREQSRLSNKLYREKNPDKVKNSKIKNLYGITLVEYNRMFETQNGLCRICGLSSSKRLCVDHDHKTGKVRDLLCHLCNSAVGSVREDVRTAKALVSYLEFYKI